MKRNWSECNAESEEVELVESRTGGKAARTSEFHFDFFGDQNVENMYTADFRNKAIQAFLKFDKKKIDELMERNYDVFSSGIWNELMQKHNYKSIKYLLTDYFLDIKTRRQAFRDSILYGSKCLAKFIIDNFKSALKKRSVGLIYLACQKKRYKILKMMSSEGYFDVNLPVSLNGGKSALHNAVIDNDPRLVKVLIRFKNIEVNRPDDLFNTPLHYATDIEIVEVLLKNGADVTHRNLHDLDPVSLAAKWQRYDLVQAMLSDLLLRFDHFHLNYKKSTARIEKGTFHISRERVLEDSYYLISKAKNWNDLKFHYKIKFVGENGYDAGGLTREWMSLLIQRFFVPRLPDEPIVNENNDEVEDIDRYDNDDDDSDDSDDSSESNDSNDESTEVDEESVNITTFMSDDDLTENFIVPIIYRTENYFYCPFECVDADNKLYRISLRFTGPVEVYKVIGSILARSLLLMNPLKVKLVPSILKLLLGKILTFEDLKEDDSVMYRSMLHCLEPGFDFASALYTMPRDDTVAVNAKNVKRFLDEYAVDVMYYRYKAQLDQLINGFRSAIRLETVAAYFSPLELQNILSGSDEIDLSDLCRNVQIRGPIWQSRAQIFWKAISFLKQSELIELVRFITGINGLPFGGLSSLNKHISIFDETRYSVPKASTCNYHLSLPTSIQTVEELVQMFKVAISSDPEFVDRLPCY